MKRYAVRGIRCSHRATEEQLDAALRSITDPLARSWEQLGRARTVVVKTNMVWPPERLRYHAGRRQEHVDDMTFRCVLRLLRERTQARLLVADTTLMGSERPGRDVNFLPILAEFGAEYVECSDPPLGDYAVPGGGVMFGHYRLHECLRSADAVVSLAKLKNHGFMGVTMCLKNLFGLPPLPPAGRPRSYFHHIIRLPYVLPDLGLIVRPCLNIVDALVAQAGREWGGDARICDTLIAGDHPVATDACGIWLMGHDPAADWPTPPFRRDRNAIRVAAEHGFGTADLGEIDFQHDLSRPIGQFDSDPTDPGERVESWRRTMCQQALHYRDHAREIQARYPNEYIYLQGGEVVWHGHSPEGLGSRRGLSRGRADSALWLKYVDPQEWEQEHFEAYEDCLRRMNG